MGTIHKIVNKIERLEVAQRPGFVNVKALPKVVALPLLQGGVYAAHAGQTEW